VQKGSPCFLKEATVDGEPIVRAPTRFRRPRQRGLLAAPVSPLPRLEVRAQCLVGAAIEAKTGLSRLPCSTSQLSEVASALFGHNAPTLPFTRAPQRETYLPRYY
jgi:hypothetical protein